MGEKTQKDLVGQRFGKLLVLEKCKERSSDGHLLYKCQCECGNITYVQSNNLSCGGSTRCPVCGHKKGGKKLRKDITGQKFGLLTALYPIGSTKDWKQIWQCKCECGSFTQVTINRLTTGRIISCGCILSKGEAIVKNILRELDIEYHQQHTFKECRNPKTNALFRFDFYLPSLNVCIEYDGDIHFSYNNRGWNTKEHLEEVHYRDSLKNKFCEENNIPFIRIPYWDYDKLNEEYLKSLLAPYIDKEEAIGKSNS